MLHLPFSEGVGTSVKDTSQFANNGIINSATWIEGRKGLWALDFDGNDDFVSILDSPSMRYADGSFSVVYWMWANAVQNTHCDTLGTESSIASQKGWTVRNLNYFYVNDGLGIKGRPNFRVKTETWQHIALVCDRDLDTLEMYVESMPTGSPTDISMCGGFEKNVGLQIGWTDSAARRYTGILVDVRVYKRVLDPIEIRNLNNLRQII